jgi:D-alanyl-lipoteichoic acid acyltransferase DltB (MBOAT superfamily)
MLLCYFTIRSWWLKKFILLIGSYLFYAAWNPPFVLLLWISTVIDWFAAKGIERSKSRPARWSLLLVSLVVNLGFLAFFKYGNFVLENYYLAAEQFGILYSDSQKHWDIILPVGISFYTFQTLSYTIDVYRGKSPTCKSFLDFALYVTFFPQLVAGPIVRSTDFLPQCIEQAVFCWNKFNWGLSLLILGLFEKVVLADGLLAPVVEATYDATSNPDFVSAWIGTLAFSGQIFCDFAGYSTCAIGVAMCLGFSLPDNFRFPYAAVGFSDFWRRWHISLSSWLRDYLYIPLGGNRKGAVRTYINLMLTMLTGGLWHGASWTFVVWGGLHGIYLAIERYLSGLPMAQLKIWKSWPAKMALSMLTYFAVCITWIYFRAKSFQQAFAFTAAMFGLPFEGHRVVGSKECATTLIVVGLIVATHWVMRDRTLEIFVTKIPGWLWMVALAAMLFLVLTVSSDDRSFIYFQF